MVALTGQAGSDKTHREVHQFGDIVRTVVVWRDDGYGLIDWKQRAQFGRPFGVEFMNPDFAAYAQSFGLAAFRPASAADLYPTLMRALDHASPTLVEVPIDCRESLRLTRTPRRPIARRVSMPLPGSLGVVSPLVTDSARSTHVCPGTVTSRPVAVAATDRMTR